ncbi:MAG: hypothetical protein PHV78_03375 [Patescibacteria group bacterium]|nr:hypothetical protein [Patescibacteria group bacterium]MDD5121572.1 hypothetical protein [Patescibacteria group bacterium]MDD5396264.1 hypothetical protein [Patescibacteria group bacterium]
MKKTIFVGLIILTTTVLVGAGCSNSNQKAGDLANTLPAQTNDNQPVVCQDPPCLVQYFLRCQPATLSMNLGEGVTYVIKVLGLEDGKCHWQSTITSGQTPSSETNDCYYPLADMTTDTIDHLFGADKVAGKEAVLQAQNNLFQANCTAK